MQVYKVEIEYYQKIVWDGVAMLDCLSTEKIIARTDSFESAKELFHKTINELGTEITYDTAIKEPKWTKFKRVNLVLEQVDNECCDIVYDYETIDYAYFKY